MKRNLVLHPFAFALFPVVNLLSGNLAEAEPSDAIPVAAITSAMTLTVLWVARMLLKDTLKAGMIASGFVFFAFAPFILIIAANRWLTDFYAPAIRFSATAVYAALVLGFLGWVYFFIKKAAGLEKLNPILNVVSLCLLSVPAWTIINSKLAERIDWPGIQRQRSLEPLVSTKIAPQRLPDIYYLVMDRYAGVKTLQTIYQFNNQEFLDHLKMKGFQTAAQSAANYPSTAHSLASSLNLNYINYLKGFVDGKSDSRLPLHSLLQDHRVGRFLKDKGYHYIHLGSWWEPTRMNKFADTNVYFTHVPEMYHALHGTTIFKPVSEALGFLDLRYEHWRGNRNQFKNLAKVFESKGPKFVLAHFLLPHDPYVFNRDGTYRTVQQTSQQPDEINYVDQLVYTNRMLQDAIAALLAKSERPPVIVVQADEGPWPARYVQQYNFDWSQATDAELNQKMKILNSLYLPGVKAGLVYPRLSPVNNFRLIFNLYFGTNLPLLPDESFVNKQRRPYDLMNITAKLSQN
jgi:hypothetical protein